ncbi:MAG: hypothetical protein JW910_22345 [Anaerolineae bacterium]|nr:hypothetical protein [Anaerolineae bacterium]
MPVEQPDAFNEAEQHELEEEAAESILGDPSLRDELTDDEARPLIDWGLHQVAALAKQVASQGMAETMRTTVTDMRRLMKRINRLAGHRAQGGGEEQLRNDLRRLGKVSAELFGEAITPPDEVTVEAFIAEQASLSNEQLVNRLLSLYAPPEGPPPQLKAPPESPRLTAPPEPGRLSAPSAPGLLPEKSEYPDV